MERVSDSCLCVQFDKALFVIYDYFMDQKRKLKYRAIALEYLKSFNMTEALMKNGNYKNRNVAKSKVPYILASSDFQAVLQEIHQEIEGKELVTVAELVHEARLLAFQNFYAVLEKIKKGETLTEDEQKTVAQYSETVLRSQGKETTLSRKYKPWSKEFALGLLFRYKGLDKLTLEGELKLSFDKEDETL